MIRIYFGSADIPTLKQVKELIMATQAEFDSKIEELKSTIAAEKEEAVAVIKSAVSEAISPLESTIAELRTQLEEGLDYTNAIASLESATAAVRDIVTSDRPEPAEPVPPSESETTDDAPF
ncbi:hypothetical protein H6F43_03840 [Leptolyngbya sp. FACHB-36]|uniref:hypothetical protein n=1 Tax=Leptolyngbya sp. FACHB-36 TaxID=2692808 RepID=UPI00168098CB|nr:hypothetical protein [Leptolyngbya sp. FACHB-36]MBD2019314.1 hypothetical protein [Leptolyngbya sp. FACHB-36]